MNFLLRKMIACTLLLLTTTMIAQTYQGKVVDQRSTPLPFVNVAAYSIIDSTLISGVITDDDGRFEIAVNQQEIYFKISFIGYSSYFLQPQESDLGMIMLQEETTQLDEVLVSARRVKMVRQNDRIVMSIENTVAENAGSALDVLEVIPNVTLKDDELKMFGKSEVRVMINGRIILMNGIELNNYLLSIPSDQIQTIEVITTPPAEYDAEGNGGMINVILKKGAVDFWNVQLRGRAYQRSHFSYAGGATLNYRRTGTGLTLDIGGGEYQRSNTFNNIYDYGDQLWLGGSRPLFKFSTNDIRIAFSQQVMDALELGLNYSGTLNALDGFSDSYRDADISSGGTLLSIGSRSQELSERTGHIFNVYGQYKIDSLGAMISADFDYYSTTSEQTGGARAWNRSDISNLILDTRATTDHDFENLSGKIDLSLPMSWADISLGAKGSFSKTLNDYKLYDTGQTTPDVNRSNVFDFTEQILAAYFSGSRSLSDRVSTKAGLRVEHTYTKGISQNMEESTERKFLNWFPTLFLTYRLKDEKSLTLSISKRTRRPNFEQLNPFVTIIDPYTTAEGNAFINPAYYTNLELTYNTSNNELRAYYNYTQDGFNQVGQIDKVSRLVAYNYFNHITDHQIGLANTYIFDQLAWLTSYNSIHLYYEKENSSIAEILGPLYSVGGHVQSNNNMTISDKVNMSVNANYYLPSRSEYSRSESLYTIGLGISAKLLEDRVHLTMTARDIFKTGKSRSYSYYDGVKTSYDNYFDQQSVNLNIRYIIGSSKVKTKSQRVGNQEIQNRM